MSDFEKKIGKKKLSGLLNKDEPEPTPTKGWKSGGYGSGYRDYNEAQGNLYGGSGYGLGRGRGTAGRGARAPASSTKGVDFRAEGTLAVISAIESRRMIRLMQEAVRIAVQNQGMYLAFGSESEVQACLEDILLGGNVKVHNFTGSQSLTIIDEATFELTHSGTDNTVDDDTDSFFNGTDDIDPFADVDGGVDDD